MSELSQALKKSASTIVLGVALAGSLAGLGYSIHTNKQMEKTYEHNMRALSDTIHYYTGKNGVNVANKDIWVGPINEAFEERFKELQEQLDNMKVRNADQVVYVETEVVNEVHDTTYIIDRNLEYLKKEFSFTNNFRDLEGYMELNNNNLGLNITRDVVRADYTLAIKDGRVYLSSDNPYVLYNEIQGVTIPKPKKPRFSVGIGPIGFDSRYFRSRLGVIFDWYRKDTKDWLVTPPVMGIVGASAPSINGGAVRNSGVELSFTWNDNIGDFRYSVGLNGSYNKNNVLYINNADGIIHGEKKIISENVAKEDGFRAEPGKPIGYFLGIASEGIFQNQKQIDEYNAAGYAFMNGYEKAEPGDVIWIDQNGDGKYDEKDCVEIGNPHPDFTMGFNFSMQWKGFDFSVNGSGAFGQQVMQSYREFALRDTQNYTNNLLARYWTGEGSTNKFPRFSAGSHNNFKCNSYNSDIFIQDADYIKIRNLTLGYDLKTAIKRLPFQSFRFFVTGQNLFTFTKYDGMDPEVGSGAPGYSWSSGIDTGFYPSPKVYMAGVSIKF